MSLLNGARCLVASLTIPPAGGWFADVTLVSGGVPSPGAATLVLGDLSLVGRILPGRGGLDAPEQPHVIVAAGYGWRTRLAKGLLKSPTGVRLSTILETLSRATGEAYEAPPEVRLSNEYGWTEGTRGRAVLADLVARGAIPRWTVAPTGRTTFTAWPTRGAADTTGRIIDRDLDRGMRVVALDTRVKAWLPGATVQGVRIERVRFVESESDLKVEAYDA